MEFGRKESDEVVNNIVRNEFPHIKEEIKKVEERIREEKVPHVLAKFNQLSEEIDLWKSAEGGRRGYNLRSRKTKG